jgi:hypothetical protein
MFFGSASTLAPDRVVDPELVGPVKEHLPLLLAEEVKLPESMNCFVTCDLASLYWPLGQGDPNGHGSAVPLAIHLIVAREDAIRHPARDILGEHARAFMLDRGHQIGKMRQDLWAKLKAWTIIS